MPGFKNKGHTLVELTTAVVIASISVMIMIGAYSAINRIWYKSNRRQQAQSSVWQVYTKISRLLKNSSSITPCSDNTWFFISNSDTIMLRYTDTSLYLDTLEIKPEAPLIRFSLKQVDSINNIAIYECTASCSLRGTFKSLVWRDAPSVRSVSDRIPATSNAMNSDSSICLLKRKTLL